MRPPVIALQVGKISCWLLSGQPFGEAHDLSAHVATQSSYMIAGLTCISAI